MNKTILSLVCLCLTVVIVIIIKPTKIKTIYRIDAPNKPASPSEVFDILDSIKKINLHNARVKSITADIKAKVNKMPVRLDGLLAYEKPRGFRMQINSFLGREVDIGSNKQLFWFYCKRMKPAYLYYSNYSDINKTRLRSVFHPLWLMESLGLSDITYSGFTVKSDFCWELAEWRADIGGKPVLKKTLVDPKRLAVLGHYLFDFDGNLLASSEVESFYKFKDVLIPQSIRYAWYEENEVLTIQLNNIIVNKNLNSSFWQMPQMRKSWNIGNGLDPP